jgi:hypothetical protein
MPIDYDTLPNPTNAQLLALARSEYAKALQAWSLAKGDRRLERQRIDDLWNQIEKLQQLVSNEQNPGDGGIILAELR